MTRDAVTVQSYRYSVEALFGEKLAEKVGSNSCCSFLLKSLLMQCPLCINHSEW